MEFDLRRYLRLLGSWWWLIALGAIIPTAVSYYFVSRQPDVYQAKVVLMVGATLKQQNPSASALGLAGQLAGGYAEMVRYRPITSEVIRKLNLQVSPDVLALQISTIVRPEANLLEIYLTDRNAKVAALIANALADELIQQSPASQTEGEQQRFVEEELNSLKAKIEQVQKDISEQNAKLAALTSASDIQAVQEKLSSLESVLSRYRTEHAAYLQSYAGESINQLTVVEPAIEPSRPVAGKKPLILGVAAVAGIGLALAGVFLIEYLDETLQWDESQEQKLLGWSVLGALGHISSERGKMVDLISERSPEGEAIRALRTAILLRRSQDAFQTLLVTSPGSQEGKSFTTASLGASMAAAGLRVILVDGDMRKPTLHERFDLPNVYGLADLLEPSASEEGAESLRGLQDTGVDRLRLLSAGTLPLDPTMLLMSPRYPRLVARLCERADLVIFDGPPVLLAADMSILAAELDAIVVVVAQGTTVRNQLQKARTVLQGNEKAHVLGVVFNQVRLRGQSYSYYYAKPRRATWMGILSDRVSYRAGRVEPVADDPNRLVGLSEAAERLGVSQSAVRRWARLGRLPMVREGLRWRVRQADVEALIAHETPARTRELTPAQVQSMRKWDLPRSSTQETRVHVDAEAK
jgi:capsular exopolysaccharide synthesis family protein